MAGESIADIALRDRRRTGPGSKVAAYGEYGGEDLALEDLVQEELLALDYKQFVLEALIAAYWGNAPEWRPEAETCWL